MQVQVRYSGKLNLLGSALLTRVYWKKGKNARQIYQIDCIKVKITKCFDKGFESSSAAAVMSSPSTRSALSKACDNPAYPNYRTGYKNGKIRNLN